MWWAPGIASEATPEPLVLYAEGFKVVALSQSPGAKPTGDPARDLHAICP